MTVIRWTTDGNCRIPSYGVIRRSADNWTKSAPWEVRYILGLREKFMSIRIDAAIRLSYLQAARDGSRCLRLG
jgi:hypothetical protein